MRKVWIVVANSTHSKIFRAENVHKLIEHKCFEHPEGHLNARDLTADRQGRSTSRVGYGTDTNEETTPIKVKEANNFAHEIADFLKTGFHERHYERIYLIAKPPFLGHLRHSLHPNVANMVAAEIQKDLTQLKPEQIREYLPPVL